MAYKSLGTYLNLDIIVRLPSNNIVYSDFDFSTLLGKAWQFFGLEGEYVV